MKKIIFLAFLALSLNFSCHQKTSSNYGSESDTLSAASFLDKYHNAFHAKDINTIKDMLSDEGLYCGTDSKEVLNKDSVIVLISRIFSDTLFKTNYDINKREIRISENGNAAVAVEQFTIIKFKQEIPMRFISHLHKKNNKWKFDFGSYSYIPQNEEVGKTKKALEQ